MKQDYNTWKHNYNLIGIWDFTYLTYIQTTKYDKPVQ